MIHNLAAYRIARHKARLNKRRVVVLITYKTALMQPTMIYLADNNGTTLPGIIAQRITGGIIK